MSDNARLRANAHAIRATVRDMQRALGKFESFVDHVIKLVLSDPEPPTPGACKMLSPRQNDVLRLMAKGLGTKDMARELGVSTGTVKTHIAVLYQRLGITNRAQAATFATRFLYDEIAGMSERLEQLNKQQPIALEMARHKRAVQ